LRKSKKRKGEMLRQAQHDEIEPRCHSEERLRRRISGFANSL